MKSLMEILRPIPQVISAPLDATLLAQVAADLLEFSLTVEKIITATKERYIARSGHSFQPRANADDLMSVFIELIPKQYKIQIHEKAVVLKAQICEGQDQAYTIATLTAAAEYKLQNDESLVEQLKKIGLKLIKTAEDEDNLNNLEIYLHAVSKIPIHFQNHKWELIAQMQIMCARQAAELTSKAYNAVKVENITRMINTLAEAIGYIDAYQSKQIDAHDLLSNLQRLKMQASNEVDYADNRMKLRYFYVHLFYFNSNTESPTTRILGEICKGIEKSMPRGEVRRGGERMEIEMVGGGVG